MSGLSLPVNRNTGQALVVASPGNRARTLEVLHDLGFVSTEADDPFVAMAEPTKCKCVRRRNRRTSRSRRRKAATAPNPP